MNISLVSNLFTLRSGRNPKENEHSRLDIESGLRILSMYEGAFMKVIDFMTKDVITLTPDRTVQEAAELMCRSSDLI